MPIGRRPSPAAATSTASPASKSPSTSTTPTGSRLVPCSRSARSAPGSTSTVPRALFAYFSQSLKLDSRRACGWKRVPTGSPATARSNIPGCVPLQITTGMPAEVAISAHSTLLRIPPEPDVRARHPDLVARAAPRRRAPRARAGGRVAARVARVQAVHVREHDHQVGGHQDRDLGRQDVVVAEADLVGRRRVVLVDHRHDLPLDELCERAPRVHVLLAPGDVEEGQQHLRRLHAMLGQQLRVDVVERALTDGRRRPAAPRSRAGAPPFPSGACRARSRPT